MKNKDGVEVKVGQLWMSMDKSRPMRVGEVEALYASEAAAMVNVATGVETKVNIDSLRPGSKGWKLIGTAL